MFTGCMVVHFFLCHSVLRHSNGRRGMILVCSFVMIVFVCHHCRTRGPGNMTKCARLGAVNKVKQWLATWTVGLYVVDAVFQYVTLDPTWVACIACSWHPVTTYLCRRRVNCSRILLVDSQSLSCPHTPLSGGSVEIARCCSGRVGLLSCL